jgi:hypothetical protein
VLSDSSSIAGCRNLHKRQRRKQRYYQTNYNSAASSSLPSLPSVKVSAEKFGDVAFQGGSRSPLARRSLDGGGELDGLSQSPKALIIRRQSRVCLPTRPRRREQAAVAFHPIAIKSSRWRGRSPLSARSPRRIRPMADESPAHRRSGSALP